MADSTSGPLSGPLVIGALGGSGTRVVAQVFMDAGYHMGHDLNSANDNLTFTLLCKRTRWYRRVVEAAPDEIQVALNIMEKASLGGPALTADEQRFVRRAAWEMVFCGHDHKGRGRGFWPLARARRLRRSSQGRDSVCVPVCPASQFRARVQIRRHGSLAGWLLLRQVAVQAGEPYRETCFRFLPAH